MKIHRRLKLQRFIFSVKEATAHRSCSTQDARSFLRDPLFKGTRGLELPRGPRSRLERPIREVTGIHFFSYSSSTLSSSLLLHSGGISWTWTRAPRVAHAKVITHGP